jgi:DNA-binding CsgD family transcriptional regulator
MSVLTLNSREWARIRELLDALSSSLDLTEVFSRFHAVMSRLFPSDLMALCVSKPGRPTAYDWMAPGMPASFFERYDEMAEHDFVRSTVARRPDKVFRETEMISRAQLVRNPMYERFRSLGMPLEHCMSVLLSGGPDWHCGLTLYRGRGRGFSDHSQALLEQWVAPRLVPTVRNCRMFAEELRSRRLLEALGQYRQESLVILAPPSSEVKRTGRATEVLEKWFSPSERGPSGLPKVLLEHLSRLVRADGGRGLVPDTWEKERREGKLKVTFSRLPVEGRLLWVLTLEEVPRDLLSIWRGMVSKSEARVLDGLILGYSNEDIAADLHRAEGTVKKQLTSIYKKLGVDGRADLISRALRR